MLEDLSYIQCRDLLEPTGIKNISESSGENTIRTMVDVYVLHVRKKEEECEAYYT